MTEKTKTLKVTCPDCQATLTIEPSTGLVIHTERKKSDYSLEKAVEMEQARKSQADEMFARAFKDEEERHRSLEDKFEKALEHQDELDDPTRPFDLD